MGDDVDARPLRYDPFGRRRPSAAARWPFRGFSRGVRPAIPKPSMSSRRLNRPPTALSLTAVQKMSVGAGMNYQMVFRSPGTPAITPASGCTGKVGHYAALLGTDPAGRFQVEDPSVRGTHSHDGGDIGCRGERVLSRAKSGPLPLAGGAWGPKRVSAFGAAATRAPTTTSGATGQDEIQAVSRLPHGGLHFWVECRSDDRRAIPSR